LVILTDDVGFSATSPFGGPIPTPALERLAQEGLRYNTFHTTALCSPTRAALLSGRNHHSAATGVIMELGTGYPGYNSLMPKSADTFAEVLKQNGYNTAWYGKNHNVPDWQSSEAGPFDLWPTDCNIYVRSQRAGERVMAGIESFLSKRLKLKVNKAKSAVDRPGKRNANFNDFHSVLGFRLGPVRCVAHDLRSFSLRLFVYDGAFRCLRIQNNKIFG
jgi:arylsulfatase A-like enzyme